MCLLIRFYRGKRKAEKYWRESGVGEITGLGTTKSLAILPLIDWYTSSEGLKGEAGVSYLIKTDANSILFDVGYNVEQSDPSPLLHNMKQLGVSMDDFDTIVISHKHCDHVGGTRWEKGKSFSLTTHQVNLEGKAVYTPIPMTYPGLNPLCTEAPTVIAEGVATIGAIPNQDFFLGWILEQALAVNVEGKGIVVVMGCGHQTLSKIIKRAEALFKGPIYGVIGGLHYPVTDSREKMMGIKIQKYAGTCRLPWKPLTMENVKESIGYLKKLNPGVVGLSAHDSCDASIAAFRNAFPNAYRDVKVGEEINIAGSRER